MRRLAPLLVLALAACSSSPVVRLYEGPERPVDEVLRVEVPMELEVLTINERRVERLGGLLSYGVRELHLPPGEWRFVAHYQDLFELDADRHDVVKSDPALFRVSGSAGGRFRLGFEPPASLEEARALAEHFDGWVENIDSGERVSTRPAGIVTMGGFLDMVAPTTASPGTSSTPRNTAGSDTGSATGERLQQLKTLWNEAAPEERQQFLLWLAE